METQRAGGQVPEQPARQGRGLEPEYDVVVVGAGSSGCAVARRLLDRTQARVLLLEAGGDPTGVDAVTVPTRWVENIGSPRDWGYGYAPSPHTLDRALHLARGKGLGGSSSINALVWGRGHPDDYDGWAAVAGSSWSWDAVLPLFRRMEDRAGGGVLRGTGGPVHVEPARELHPVAQALLEAGPGLGLPLLDDTAGQVREGVGPADLTVRDGVRVSAWDGYLRPVLGHERLTVVPGAQVVELLLDGPRCTGVRVLLDGKVLDVAASAEVVLCAGAVDTPRLLLLSGIGPADELRQLGVRPRHDLPGVGQGLQEHVLLAGVCVEAREPLVPFSHNLEGSLATWRSRPDAAVPDLVLVPIQVPYVSAEVAADHPVPPNAFCLAPGLFRPQSRGSLRMLTARHDGPLELQPQLLAEPSDVEALLVGLETAQELACSGPYAQLGARRVAPRPGLSRAEAVRFVRSAALPYFHPVGTCAMGSDEGAVVDGELRVHGLSGLRIADASVMPTIPTAFTNAPALLVGERAGDLLARAHGSSLVAAG